MSFEQRFTPVARSVRMDIGKPLRKITVEPLTAPVPRERPAAPPEPAPAKRPTRKREPAPAR